MKKLIIYIFILFCLYGCSEDYCTYIDQNEIELNELISVIEKNPSEFFNNANVPRVYYTYNYSKNYNEFLKSEKTQIDESDFLKSKKLFKHLGINEMMIYNNQNILFKIQNKDFFLSELNVFVGYFKNKEVEKLAKDLDIINMKKCKSNWFYIISRKSIAN